MDSTKPTRIGYHLKHPHAPDWDSGFPDPTTRRRPRAPSSFPHYAGAMIEPHQDALLRLVDAGGSAATRRALLDAHREPATALRSEEHTSELQSLMRISYAVFCLKNKTQEQPYTITRQTQ